MCDLACRRASRGFTLIEVLISLAVLGLITGLVLQAILASQGVSREVTSRWEAARTAQALLNRVCDDIRRTSAVDAASTSTTLVLWIGGSEVTYAVSEEGFLTRNSTPIHSGRARVSSMELVYLSSGNPAPEAASPADASAVMVRLTVEQGGNSLEVSAAAGLRNTAGAPAG